RRDQRRVIAARKVGTPDRALEKHVADDRQPRPRMKENYVTRRVSGRMSHFEPLPAELHRVAVDQPAVGLEGGGAAHAEHRALLAELLDPEAVVLVRSFDRHAV